MTVSRFDIVEFVGDLFDRGPIEPHVLIFTARRRGARPAVLHVLRQLPARPYASLSELLAALPALPDEIDPWDTSN